MGRIRSYATEYTADEPRFKCLFLLFVGNAGGSPERTADQYPQITQITQTRDEEAEARTRDRAPPRAFLVLPLVLNLCNLRNLRIKLRPD